MVVAGLSEKLKVDAEQNLVLRPALRPYVVFGIIWGGMGLLQFITWLSHPNPSFIQSTCVCICLLAAFWAFIRSHKIQLQSMTLRYRSFPWGTAVIPIGEIRDARLGRIALAGGIKSFGFQTILIRFNRSQHRKPVVINARMFDPKDMLRLIDTLKQAGIDATAEGRN